MSARPFLSFKYQAIVRLVHAGGRVTVEELLTRYQAQALSAPALRSTLGDLVRLGWVSKLHLPRPGCPKGVAWAVTEEALPHLWLSRPLPRTPAPLPASATDTHFAPPPKSPARPAPRPAHVPQPRRPDFGAPYVPPPAPPMRAGALDFLKYPSHGACNDRPVR